MDKMYCLKCKSKQAVKNVKEVKTKGKSAVTAECDKCGGKIFKFVNGKK